MPTVHASNAYGALEEATLASFEAWLEAPLPDDYRAFLLAHNGGIPEPSGFDGGEVECFFALHDQVWDADTPGGHLAQPLQSLAVDWSDEFPERPLLPIGRDTDGRLLCLGVHGADRGRLFLADPGEDYAPRPLAGSFAAFFGALRAA